MRFFMKSFGVENLSAAGSKKPSLFVRAAKPACSKENAKLTPLVAMPWKRPANGGYLFYLLLFDEIPAQ